MTFERSVVVQCRVHEQINTAYQNKIVQRAGSFCNENCRLWMNIEWNELEIGQFSLDGAKASDCGPMCLLRAVVLKTCRTRRSVLHCLLNWAVLCGQRSCFIHETCQVWSAPTETSSLVFRFHLALSGMMPAYSCNYRMLDSFVAPKIIYWTAYGCIKFCNLVAYNCTRQSYNSQVLFWNYCYRICKHSTFKRLFHNW